MAPALRSLLVVPALALAFSPSAFEKQAWSGPAFKAATLEAPSSAGVTEQFVDEEALFARSTFPITPNALIARCKEVLGPSIGIGTKDGGECLAEDFEFVAAVVGPLGKKEYLKALETFQLEDASPAVSKVSNTWHISSSVWLNLKDTPSEHRSCLTL